MKKLLFITVLFVSNMVNAQLKSEYWTVKEGDSQKEENFTLTEISAEDYLFIVENKVNENIMFFDLKSRFSSLKKKYLIEKLNDRKISGKIVINDEESTIKVFMYDTIITFHIL